MRNVEKNFLSIQVMKNIQTIFGKDDETTGFLTIV